MTAKKTPEARPDVTIYPTGDAWIPDVEPVEQTVSAERADELLAYSPAAFTTDKPEPAVDAVVESPATPPTEPSGDAGATPQEA